MGGGNLMAVLFYTLLKATHVKKFLLQNFLCQNWFIVETRINLDTGNRKITEYFFFLFLLTTMFNDQLFKWLKRSLFKRKN